VTEFKPEFTSGLADAIVHQVSSREFNPGNFNPRHWDQVAAAVLQSEVVHAILADAWDEGRRAAYEEFEKDPRGLYFFARNPYRVSEPVDVLPKNTGQVS
jgi:hypothetical protein